MGKGSGLIYNGSRTGRYKFLAVLAAISSAVCYVLLILRWHGKTNVWESLYIAPGSVFSSCIGLLEC